MATKESRKRKVLSLEQRVRVIERHNNGKSARSIAASLDVGKTQIQSIINERDWILQLWEGGESGDRKYAKARRSSCSRLNELVWDWFCAASSKNLPITGKLLQEKALMLSKEMGYGDFTASNGWLNNFQKRHDIKVFCVLSGDTADVSAEAVDIWLKHLPDLYQGFAAKDIFSADETGLLFRTLPDRSLVKKDACIGGKDAKNHITVLLACSATGEKLRPLVIGKSAKPRCMRRYFMSTLPVTYHSNRKACMTIDIFRIWVSTVNNKMRRENRHILLFVDNSATHLVVSFSNVKMVFLPPNSTSRLQPFNAGIMLGVKAIYRKKMLHHIIFKMDDANVASDVAKSINIIDAILWLNSAWEELTPFTIQKCFLKCGFQCGDMNYNATGDVEEERETIGDLKPLLGEISLEEFANSDNILLVHNTITEQWEKDIIKAARGSGIVQEEDDKASSEEDEVVPQPPIITVGKAAEYLAALRDFGLHHEQSEFCNTFVGTSATVLGRTFRTIFDFHCGKNATSMFSCYICKRWLL
uniref:HTH CENPB-type domain-containing protein n=1 Tax=Eptatretus burgeri TaxID=7764 RepID=A0A8C4QQL2_EPTBU